jgi:iron complex transport system ATP-binding protein
MIEVEHLTVVERHKVLLEDVSFSLRAGEIVALLGPNGAGKSTLMKTMIGLLRPTRGSISIGGKPIAAYAPREKARVLAYMAQQQEFVWDLEVGEVVALGAVSSAHAASTLSQLALVDLSRRRIKSLSGGERARVMLARALAAETPFLFADEPAANLDIKQQRHVMRLLRGEVQRRKLGVFVVIHDLNLAFEFADRVLLLEHGRLVLDDTAARTAASPELDRVFDERFTRTSIDGHTVVFPTGAEA